MRTILKNSISLVCVEAIGRFTETLQDGSTNGILSWI